MTFTEAVIITALGITFLGLWLMIVAVRVSVAMAMNSQIKLMKVMKK